ncbi:plasmid replication protein [Clostridium botulinum C]|uniref:plasmid replication protein n=1 Tax=Clostridium botulinum TaxID=1491 RepID=UPI001E4C8E8D|nr:plasmid replication protein [Clostridium botulinum]MCD3217850.1 plasmid replication protein [Clostridium botulinum C]
MCKQQYLYNFKRYTKYQFNKHFRAGKKRNQLMSFYAYLINMSKSKEINISKETLTKMYNRKQSKTASKNQTTYKKVSSTTVLRWLLKLEEAKLLLVKRESNNANVYMINEDGSLTSNFFKTKKRTEKCTIKKEPQTLDTTTTEPIENVHKDYNINTINKDIDIYNSKQVTETAMTDEVYKSYLDKQEKVNAEELLTITEKMFKVMKIRSNRIKAYTLNILNYASTVSKKHAYNYVIKAIDNARARYYRERSQYRSNLNSNTVDSFNNYEQRSYDFDVLEKKLLGWV